MHQWSRVVACRPHHRLPLGAAACPRAGTRACSSMVSAAATSANGNEGNAVSVVLQDLTARLIARFGEHTTVQVREQRPKTQLNKNKSSQYRATSHVDDDDDIHMGLISTGANATTVHKASVTTRIGGFGVTLAAAADSS